MHAKSQEEKQSEEDEEDELDGFAGSPLPIQREPRLSLQDESIIPKLELPTSKSPFFHFTPLINESFIGNDLDIEDENSSFHLGFMNGSRLEDRSISSEEDTEEVYTTFSLPFDLANVRFRFSKPSTLHRDRGQVPNQPTVVPTRAPQNHLLGLV